MLFLCGRLGCNCPCAAFFSPASPLGSVAFVGLFPQYLYEVRVSTIEPDRVLFDKLTYAWIVHDISPLP